MATGARTSLQISSEPFYDFLCTPCAKEGNDVEAFRYCVECSERICTDCLKHHNKFEIMRNHDLLDEAGMNALGPQLLPPMPRQKCSLHHGKVLEMYCGTHDFVYCTICIALDHRSCTGIDNVPKVAKYIAKSQEFKDATANINDAERDLHMLKKGRDLDRLIIKEKKKKISAAITDYRKQINNLLDDLEKSSRTELDISYKRLETKINEDLSYLDDLLLTLRQKVKELTSFDTNESQLFVDMKEAMNKVNESEILKHKVEMNLSTEPLHLSIDCDIFNYLSKLTSLCKLNQQKKTKSSNLIGQYDVTAKDNKGTCEVSDACYMPDGSIVIADANNAKLKLLDQSYLPSGPYAVCRTGPTEVATSLYHDKKVQFASINDDLITLTNSFNVGGNCMGMAYCNGEVNVTCGGETMGIPGQIQVYDKVGTRLRTILNDSSNKQIFTIPSNITEGLNSTQLHVADMEKGIINIDTQGQVQQIFIDPDLKCSMGVCVTENGSIIACGYGSNNVILFDIAVQKQVELLSDKDGIKKPTSVSYDIRNRRMIVTMKGCDYIRVYDIV